MRERKMRKIPKKNFTEENNFQIYFLCILELHAYIEKGNFLFFEIASFLQKSIVYT